MDRSQKKFTSFSQHPENEREEEKESYNLSAMQTQKTRFGEKNDADDKILLEFKKKYQKSLEAIQSFQEILELKKKLYPYHSLLSSSNLLLTFESSISIPSIEQIYLFLPI